MPELPEVQIVVNGINRDLVGKTITSFEVHWQPYVIAPPGEDPADLLVGQTFRKASRRGKFILMHLDISVLLLHLRMTGKVLLRSRNDDFPVHTHATATLNSGDCIGFNDARKFGRLEILSADALENHMAGLQLGVEPLSEELTVEYLEPLFKGRTRPLKNILLDQQIIVGIGNIYACEICFEAGIHPLKGGGDLSTEEIAGIIEHTPRVLLAAIERGGASIRDYKNINDESGRQQDHFRVYAREGNRCIRCGGTVTKAVSAGRSTFWCPDCQK